MFWPLYELQYIISWVQYTAPSFLKLHNSEHSDNSKVFVLQLYAIVKVGFIHIYTVGCWKKRLERLLLFLFFSLLPHDGTVITQNNIEHNKTGRIENERKRGTWWRTRWVYVFRIRPTFHVATCVRVVGTFVVDLVHSAKLQRCQNKCSFKQILFLDSLRHSLCFHKEFLMSPLPAR